MLLIFFLDLFLRRGRLDDKSEISLTFFFVFLFFRSLPPSLPRETARRKALHISLWTPCSAPYVSPLCPRRRGKVRKSGERVGIGMGQREEEASIDRPNRKVLPELFFRLFSTRAHRPCSGLFVDDPTGRTTPMHRALRSGAARAIGEGCERSGNAPERERLFVFFFFKAAARFRRLLNSGPSPLFFFSLIARSFSLSVALLDLLTRPWCGGVLYTFLHAMFGDN